MLQEIQNDAKNRMEKAISSFSHELSKLRTGRAHPSVLEHVKVDYYGTVNPLNQLSNITVSDARTLTVTPWDKGAVQAIEKAILNADLGLNPATAGAVIRVPMPPLTEERRRELVKVVKAEAENARIAVRNIRRDANNSFKDLQKEKEISEDDARREEAKIQKLTDDFIAKIETLLHEKETALMEV
ncbi:MAG: ribosome recycling factor [Gammaproteobacteria bacterium]|nr:ribosome recycling factor [Gammaproteobacteria bacterium]